MLAYHDIPITRFWKVLIYLNVNKTQYHEHCYSTSKLVTFGIGMVVTFGIFAVASSLIPVAHVFAARDPIEPF